MVDMALKPFLKWPGGKTRELNIILPNLPNTMHNYYEPFIGGGAVYFAIKNASKYFINDKSKDLINLYQNIKSNKNKELVKILSEINMSWQAIDKIFFKHQKQLFNVFISFRESNNYNLKNAISTFVTFNIKDFTESMSSIFYFDLDFYKKEINVNLIRKMKRMKKLEEKKGVMCDKDIDKNILTALKSSFYMYFRMLYNNRTKYNINSTAYSAIYFYIRNYTYSGMFRYNANGEFNVPYGGIGYNGNSLENKITYISSDILQSRLKNTVIGNEDFYDFMFQNTTQHNDFIFLDPPYDSQFNTYDKNSFTQKDQIRLSNFLINETNCKWMLVIKNTEFIHGLYRDKKLDMQYFDKSYNVSFMNRNDRDSEHLLIRNYKY